MRDDATELLAGIAASLQPEAKELSAQLVAQMLEEIPDLTGDQAIVELLTSSVGENVTNALHVFEAGADRVEISPPPAALEYARRLAQRGIPISAVLRAYRLGQAGFHQTMMSRVAAAQLSADRVAEASMALSKVLFDYIDLVSEEVVAAYQFERDSWLRNRVAARSAKVSAVLASKSVDVPDAEKVLSYRFNQTHLGVVVWSDDHEGTGDRLTRLERTVQRLGEAVECQRPPLLVASDDATVWAWLPSPQLPLNPAIAADADDTVWIAAGEAAAGVAGFRLTHRQARQAQVVAAAAAVTDRARVTSSSEVGAIALMCADLEATAAWVRATLGDLALDDEPHERLRETLWAFLASGGSYTAAAQQLILHKNTVQYRIRKAEEARGRTVHDGRLDLEVALLACRALGSSVLRAPGRAR